MNESRQCFSTSTLQSPRALMCKVKAVWCHHYHNALWECEAHTHTARDTSLRLLNPSETRAEQLTPLKHSSGEQVSFLWILPIRVLPSLPAVKAGTAWLPRTVAMQQALRRSTAKAVIPRMTLAAALFKIHHF